MLIILIILFAEGREEVLDLLDPSSHYIGRKPPKFIRAKLYKYHFTDVGEAGWWKREEQGEYLPMLTVDNDQLVNVMTNMGVISSKTETVEHNSVTVVIEQILSFLRNVSKLSPAEIQIWSYSWLSLPLFVPFLKPV